MDMTTALFIINALLGVIMGGLSLAVSSTQSKFRDLQNQQNDIRDKALLKEDFREFKVEQEARFRHFESQLWERLDQLLKVRSPNR